MPIDKDFLSGALRTTSWVFAVALLAILGTLDFRLIFGFVLGTGIGVGLLLILQWSVRTAFRPDATAGERVVVGLVTLLKYVVIGFVFWLTLSRDWISVYAFLGGFLLPQAVIFLQAVALFFIQRSGPKAPTNGSS